MQPSAYLILNVNLVQQDATIQDIGQSVTGIGYLKGPLRLPSLKRMYSGRGLGKYISEVKLGDET
jgi:hypothetical protein